MLMTKERRPAIRTLRGWAIGVLQEAGAIHECEEHGWARDRADPHARERALDIARQEPPDGISPDAALAEIRDVWTRSETLAPSALPTIDDNRSCTFRGSAVTRFQDEFAAGSSQLSATRDYKWDEPQEAC